MTRRIATAGARTEVGIALAEVWLGGTPSLPPAPRCVAHTGPRCPPRRPARTPNAAMAYRFPESATQNSATCSRTRRSAVLAAVTPP